jgi:hypothetical protein
MLDANGYVRAERAEVSYRMKTDVDEVRPRWIRS